MPFIRYAIGDYAVAADGPCPCGRTLPRLARIAGRTRNVFTFADGSQKWPWMRRRQLSQLIPAQQFQIIQTALDTIEIRYVPKAGDPPDVATVQRFIREFFHPDLTVTIHAVAEILPSSSGKMEDYISLVTPQRAPRSVRQ
jgi:phenylacetate-CoA ligase